MSLPYLDAEALNTLLSPRAAVQALHDALRGGLDPELDPPRLFSPLTAGEFLLMPAQSARYAGIKVATVAPGNPAKGHPKIQGTYLLFDGDTLTPLAAMDGAELTLIRTPAVTTLALKHLLAVRGRPDAGTLAVFGTSLQAERHVAAISEVCGIEDLIVIGRRPAAAAEFAARWAARGLAARVGGPGDVTGADVVVCATSSGEPVFDGALVRDDAIVAAIGSHGLDAREIDPGFARRADVVVEGRESALREAGDLIPARSVDQWRERGLATLADLVNGRFTPEDGAPLLYTGVGMSWEDLVVAGRAYELSGRELFLRGKPGND
ncbi:ornithine cyclodeaminase family protein [Specibacter cremeus]|uniref:ornithine cyclodeaminase family protein n=1 Tax=Specibacter cremeus TaxID=1629051 RepID=UPI000F7A34F6|nr:ornithine cyclodeaminase family protein [Specibacter cremeus]